MSGLGTDLHGILGAASVLTAPEEVLAYANDATHYFKTMPPDAVVLPTNAEDVSKVLKYANKNGIPLTPRGAGSGLAGGCTPIHRGIVMDMKRMNKIQEIDSDNLTASVEAGVVLGNFHRNVERMGLFYPPDPQSMSVCTIGGNVATRAGGPRGVKYGTTGNYVLGVDFVLPDGELIKAGGKFVKQSTGYDLTRLMTGSEGTLGVITGANLRLLTKPETNKTIIVVCETLDQAAELVSTIIARGVVPTMCEFLIKLAITVMNAQFATPLPETGEAYLFIQLDGTQDQVDREAQLIREISMDLKVIETRVEEDQHMAAVYWKARGNIYPLMMTIFKRVITEDVTVPRNRLPAFVRGVQNVAANHGVMIGQAGHAGDGNIHPTIMQIQPSPELTIKSKAALDDLIRLGLDLGGTISGEHGIGIHKQEYLEWELGANQIELMKRIKQAFDPQGIMNPGKIWMEGGEAGV